MAISSPFVRRVGMALFASMSVLALLFALGPRVGTPSAPSHSVTLPLDLEAYLRQQEDAAGSVQAGQEKHILWADSSTRAKTRDALVYFHGFSASRAELSPTLERVAERLGANVFFTRLRGHGQNGEALGRATASEWLEDAEEALAIGKQLGERVTLVGTSTGATLALSVSTRHPEVHAQVFLSPNFGPADKRSRLLLWPWGSTMAHLLIGEYRSWEPDNPRHAQYWTHHYPVEVLLQMMALVDAAEEIPLSTVRTPTLVLYSSQDDVIDLEALHARFEELGAARKQKVLVKSAQGHVLAGDILSPQSTDEVVSLMVAFLQQE